MNYEQFKIYIESIGFIPESNIRYLYKKYGIDLYSSYYDFYNGSKWVLCIEFYDLTPLKKELKKEFRSLKLKQILK